jgi:hypothetical protein
VLQRVRDDRVSNYRGNANLLSLFGSTRPGDSHRCRQIAKRFSKNGAPEKMKPGTAAGGCIEDLWLAVSVLTRLYPELDGRIGYGAAPTLASQPLASQLQSRSDLGRAS